MMKDNKEKFDFNDNAFEDEAIFRWGENAKTSIKKIRDADEDKKSFLNTEMNRIFKELSDLKNTDFKEEVVQEKIKELHLFFNNEIGDFYTTNVFRSLGVMYIEDERFKNNIDKFGSGTAEFISQAINYYCEEKKKREEIKNGDKK